MFVFLLKIVYIINILHVIPRLYKSRITPYTNSVDSDDS